MLKGADAARLHGCHALGASLEHVPAALVVAGCVERPRGLDDQCARQRRTSQRRHFSDEREVRRRHGSRPWAETDLGAIPTVVDTRIATSQRRTTDGPAEGRRQWVWQPILVEIDGAEHALPEEVPRVSGIPGPQALAGGATEGLHSARSKVAAAEQDVHQTVAVEVASTRNSVQEIAESEHAEELLARAPRDDVGTAELRLGLVNSDQEVVAAIAVVVVERRQILPERTGWGADVVLLATVVVVHVDDAVRDVGDDGLRAPVVVDIDSPDDRVAPERVREQDRCL